jgi:hypothetical protein
MCVFEGGTGAFIGSSQPAAWPWVVVDPLPTDDALPRVFFEVLKVLDQVVEAGDQDLLAIERPYTVVPAFQDDLAILFAKSLGQHPAGRLEGVEDLDTIAG